MAKSSVFKARLKAVSRAAQTSKV